MALAPELQQLISEIHKFMTITLSAEGLSENTEDKRADLVSKLGPYISHNIAITVNASHLSQSVNVTDIQRVKTISSAGKSNTLPLPEPPKAPPPGEVKRVNPKDLKSSALYEGLIEKLGGKNQEKWQKRYCILTRTYLYFFESAKCKHQNNQIYIPAFSIAPVKERGNENRLVFRLSSAQSKSYYFRVVDQETYASWYSNISQVSANSNTSVGGAMPRVETMLFNPEDCISSASSSDEGEASQGKDEDTPPPLPPPTTSIPKSPQLLRKTTPTQPSPLTLPQPQPVQQPAQIPVQPVPEQVRKIHPSPIHAATQNSDVSTPPPTPKRHGSVLNPRSGPGVSVEQMRKIKTSKNDSVISEELEDGEEGRQVSVDTGKIYETTDEEDFPYDKIYVAKWDFKGEGGDELTFKRGDLILVADPSELSSWWIGDLLHSDTLKGKDQSGLFYSVYVEPAFTRVQ